MDLSDTHHQSNNMMRHTILRVDFCSLQGAVIKTTDEIFLSGVCVCVCVCILSLKVNTIQGNGKIHNFPKLLSESSSIEEVDEAWFWGILS